MWRLDCGPRLTPAWGRARIAPGPGRAPPHGKRGHPRPGRLEASPAMALCIGLRGFRKYERQAPHRSPARRGTHRLAEGDPDGPGGRFEQRPPLLVVEGPPGEDGRLQHSHRVARPGGARGRRLDHPGGAISAGRRPHVQRGADPRGCRGRHRRPRPDEPAPFQVHPRASVSHPPPCQRGTAGSDNYGYVEASAGGAPRTHHRARTCGPGLSRGRKGAGAPPQPPWPHTCGPRPDPA